MPGHFPLLIPSEKLQESKNQKIPFPLLLYRLTTTANSPCLPLF